MEISHFIEERIIVVKITEEIDQYASEKIRRRVDYEIQRFMPKRIIFDFSDVVFMDSAGIGLLLGRYKIASVYGASVEIMNINEKLKKIFEMSGIFKIIKLLEEGLINLNEIKVSD